MARKSTPKEYTTGGLAELVETREALQQQIVASGQAEPAEGDAQEPAGVASAPVVSAGAESGRAVVLIHRSEIIESASNHRRSMNTDALAELSRNIAEVGMLQPILVRPMHVVNEAWQPVLPSDGNVEARAYEIVFGHRRFRAASKAGLTEVPCEIRQLSDAEARRLQQIENLQREDLDPIDEADGYAAFMRDEGISANELADRLNKSRTLVYDRLKLVTLCEAGRALVRDGTIGPNLGMVVARLATAELQEKALGLIARKVPNDDGGHHHEVLSFRAARTLVDAQFSRRLPLASFDRADFALLPDKPACGECPFRLGNMEADAIGARADICTQPDCFDAKTRQHVQNVAATAEATGGSVIEGDKARALVSSYDPQALVYSAKDSYLPLGEPTRDLDGLTPSDALGKKLKPQDVVHIVHPDTGNVIQAVKRETLVQHKLIEAPEPELSADEKMARQREQQQKHEAITRARHQVQRTREQQVAVLHDLVAMPPPRGAGLVLAAFVLYRELVNYSGWPRLVPWLARFAPHLHDQLPEEMLAEDVPEYMGGDDEEQFTRQAYQWLQGLDGNKLAHALLAFALMVEEERPYSAEDLDPVPDLARAYGVDSDAIAKRVEEEIAREMQEMEEKDAA